MKQIIYNLSTISKIRKLFASNKYMLGGFLIGKIKDGNIYITDAYQPKQHMKSNYTEFLEEPKPEVIGAWYHHCDDSSVRQSTVDRYNFLDTLPVLLILNKKGDINFIS